jgi:hypothetical protein
VTGRAVSSRSLCASADDIVLSLTARGLTTGEIAAVGAELVIHGGDLRHHWPVAVGHDRRSWRCDCCI